MHDFGQAGWVKKVLGSAAVDIPLLSIFLQCVHVCACGVLEDISLYISLSLFLYFIFSLSGIFPVSRFWGVIGFCSLLLLVTFSFCSLPLSYVWMDLLVNMIVLLGFKIESQVVGYQCCSKSVRKSDCVQV